VRSITCGSGAQPRRAAPLLQTLAPGYSGTGKKRDLRRRQPPDLTTDDETRALRAVADFGREDRLAIAHVEIVDAPGADAGDALRRVTQTSAAHLRPQDWTVPLGPAELVCVMPGLRLDDVRSRFAAIEQTLAAQEAAPAIRVGLAVVAPDEAAGLFGGPQ
jgi:hypothetical protein